MPGRPLLTWVNGSVRTIARLTDTTLPCCCMSAMLPGGHHAAPTDLVTRSSRVRGPPALDHEIVGEREVRHAPRHQPQVVGHRDRRDLSVGEGRGPAGALEPRTLGSVPLRGI